MSLDDHIHHLSETILGELRAPIEASLRRLLQEVLATAGRDRDEGIAQAVAAASARQESAIETALEAARAEADQRLEQAAALWRVEAEQQLQQSLDAVSVASQVEAQEALESLRAASQAEAQQALDALRASAEAERLQATAALETALLRAHDAEIALLRESTAAEIAAAVQQARAEIAGERETGAAAWHAERDEMLSRHAEEVAGLKERHHAELEAAVEAARVEAAAAARHEALEAARVETAEAAHVDTAQATLAGERQAGLACSDRLLDGFRQLDEGRSLRDVLATLTDRVAGEAGRCALLLVEGARLRGWRLAGLPGLQPSDLDVPLEEAGVLGRAVVEGVPLAASELNGTDRLPALLLSPSGRAGLAVPLLVGQRAVAVLYADDAGSTETVAPSNWPEMTEVLARHAARCLEVMTIARVAGPMSRRVLPPLPAESPAPADADEEATAVPPPGQEGPDSDAERQAESARRYARLLLSEVKLYNESAVEEGRRQGDLLARLGAEIERARRLYEEKIPAVVRERADWFEQELVRTLAGGDAALLGQVT